MMIILMRKAKIKMVPPESDGLRFKLRNSICSVISVTVFHTYKKIPKKSKKKR